ncbi:terminase large subunit (plasmid) [Pseudorhodobacter turbinis]|uniref:Terminase large subunit n=1 Tax=Pseudorhodobacter turbinis TaxID=2500533 RepID=A0A4P8EJU2_9RHOB|nr:terminase TerL endonuclease subunit [Pseudorhodobacter turbinis]QCO57460.1 terminase large subunit [Pseudorhodobacter turbinis]
MKNEIYPAKTAEDAIQYARDIVSGEILACKDVIAQCRSFIEDLDVNQFKPEFRWTFNKAAANHILTYVQLFKFIEGDIAGTPLRLANWHALYLGATNGWVDKSDPEIKRYDRCIAMVGRKNAKSTILSALAVYALVFGPEGSQIYSMGTNRDQAKLCWNMAKRLIERADPRLTHDTNITGHAISNSKKWNRYVPLSRDSKSLDGKNAYLVICDEAAAISDRNLIEVMTSSMGAQKSPAIHYITTAQAGAESNYFFEQLDYARKVLHGAIKDERIFTLAYALDEDDIWDDETNWIKSNPSLGLSVSIEFLQKEAAIAKEIPANKPNFFIKYLNLFVSTSESWLQLDKWNENIIGKLNTDGPCYIGIDLGSTDDLTAVGMVFPQTDGTYHFDAKCFVPEETFKKVPKHVRQVYAAGVESGSLIITEGDIADHNFIREYIQNLSEKYDVKEVSFDPWNASQITAMLQDSGINMVKHSQGMGAMSPSTKVTELAIRSGNLKHLDDAFLAWQISNTEVYADVNNNIKVRKGKDKALKIDAIITLIMATGRAATSFDKPKEFNFYFG